MHTITCKILHEGYIVKLSWCNFCHQVIPKLTFSTFFFVEYFVNYRYVGPNLSCRSTIWRWKSKVKAPDNNDGFAKIGCHGWFPHYIKSPWRHLQTKLSEIISESQVFQKKSHCKYTKRNSLIFLYHTPKILNRVSFLVGLQEQIPKICCRSTLQSYRRRHTISEGSKFTQMGKKLVYCCSV